MAGAAELSGYLTATTDYTWRGVTQSDSDAALQAGADLSFDSGLFIGIWGSTVDISNGPTRQRDRQVNYYIGYTTPVTPGWSLGGHVVAYFYPGAEGDIDYDYTEYSATASFEDRVWLEFSISDDLFDAGYKTKNYEVYFEQPIADSWALGGGLGYYDWSDVVGSGYGHWQLGLTRSAGHLDVDFRYHDTNRWVPIVSSPDRADARFVLSVRLSF